MYNLKNKGDTWALESNYNGTHVGSLKQVLGFAVVSLGINISELEMAVLEMNQKGHDSANFGIRGKLIYTYNERDKK